MRDVRIIIFAKAPVPGKVKTRLVPVLGEERAAELARRMLLDTTTEAITAGMGPTEICVDPEPSDPAWGDLLRRHPLTVSYQGEGDLGQRLSRAAQRALDHSAHVILIGSDCPSLDRFRLREIAAKLQDHDAVIQPAMDGGYVALGLTRFDPSLFEGIAWSTAAVAKETARRMLQLGWSCCIASPPLRDVDTIEDLQASGLSA